MDDTANGIIAGVLGGRLPDEAHEATLARFWDLFPQFQHMRDVVERVVAERRETAALQDLKITEIGDRWKAEREAAWDTLFATLLDGYDGSQESKDACNRRLEDTKARCEKILDAEMAEIRAAYHEDSEDFNRCYHFLVWYHERESMKKRRCVNR